MKKMYTLFLQAVIVLIGITALAFLIRFPLTEGRARNLDLFSIYADPFIMYLYVASIAFFVGLYKAFRLLGYIGHHNVFSAGAVQALKSIKYCAVVISIFMVVAGLYIKAYHSAGDDPAGFIAICIATAFASVTVATAAALFEKFLQNGVYKR